jgi:hypothetical protein
MVISTEIKITDLAIIAATGTRLRQGWKALDSEAKQEIPVAVPWRIPTND